ncbi:hypothetical protein NC651_021509 [Populus alba x Populus x berolinensis]|nr:hypothetical protein NC651_021509 [Populus alba x Populus x berolinensis]
MATRVTQTPLIIQDENLGVSHKNSVSSSAENPEVKQTDPGSRFYPEQKELAIPVFSDWFESSTQWHSPPCSPIHWDSPPCSPFFMEFEAVEYVLKPESDV